MVLCSSNLLVQTFPKPTTVKAVINIWTSLTQQSKLTLDSDLYHVVMVLLMWYEESQSQSGSMIEAHPD